ncbi:MAG: hypothetical protein M1541_00745, partial [Acidobacteria bacterium]|nr:hypothetical protein [Acidobacteriota bacterium]
LEATADSAYPGVSLRRTVTLRGNRVEDRFECRSAKEHVYDWAFHSAGKTTTSLKLERREGPQGAENGYQHIGNVSTARTDAAFWVRWEQGGASLTLKFAAAPGTEVFLGAGPGRDPAVMTPALIVRRRAKETVFQATHEFRP